MEVSFCWSWSHVWWFFAAKRDEHTKRFNENGVLKTESNSASNRIESNSIFEHTHYSKSKGINKSLLLRTTSVSGVGGGGVGGRVHAGPCQNPEDRVLFIRTKTGQQKDFEDSNRRIKVKDRHSQEEQKKHRRKKSDGPPFLQCLY